MKKIVHKSAAPLYAAAVVWVLYALLFPLYRQQKQMPFRNHKLLRQKFRLRRNW